jgi:hypothetical protein
VRYGAFPNRTTLWRVQFGEHGFAHIPIEFG